ncbi:MAG TPA: ABC transporter ATP-binding protein [Geminicoccaceae bacterium]|nr:ABC transporter ATP-binding protein [Geminicoccus sp.]HMU50866.1 ABC transporter ATP-binding protein [Geminicoccaceae bacterium]
MAAVDLDAVTKTYVGVTALDRVALSIRSGEFFTLLGPSGCGKTTLLRTIAGFNRQDSGSIRVAGKAIDDVPAHRRDIGLVFQDYAIFPHLTVAQNVAFGLEARGRPKAEIAARVAKALEVVQLGGMAERLPHQMSGGQQQRVGLARAMVINPQILLMDEPLSNLDAKLRIELRDDIRDLQRSLGITTIYVTHDQEEALVVSDRICVMQGGKVHQVGTPYEIYVHPATLFVASFVGSMNLLGDLPLGPAGARVTTAVRPEDVMLAEPDASSDGALILDGTVEKVSFAGREALYRIRTGGGLAVTAHIHRPQQHLLEKEGAALRLRVPVDRLHLFEPAGGKRIGPA